MTSAAEAAPKNILVVEDDETIRRSLEMKLNQWGFRAEVAKNVTEARERLKESEQPYDVAVLDIQLGDVKTGIDLGREIREAQPDAPPELVIYSGNYKKVEHYHAALSLGSADFIRKGEEEEEEIVSRIGAKALRRALNPKNPEMGVKMLRIIAEDDVWDPIAAVKNLCSQVIAPEVKACLGVPSVFLLSDTNGTQVLTRGAELPKKYESAYAQIQQRTFQADRVVPFDFSLDKMNLTLDADSRQIFQPLEGSSFLQIYENGLKLSIGILRPEETDHLRDEKDPRTLTRILDPIVDMRPSVFTLLKILSRFKAIARGEAVLKYTSNFCLYVGKTQLNVLEESLEKEEIEPDNACFRKLKRLADDLHATGVEFSHLNDREEAVVQAVSARSVVERAWQMIKEQGLAARLELRQTGADFEVRIAERDLLIAVLRVLQWLAQREDKIPPEAPYLAIEVAYERQHGRVAIRFTDQSRRLGEQLRKRLFEPFTQGTVTLGDTDDKGERLPGLYLPLYLAKTLLTEKNDGSLEDRTNELAGESGHRFVISFPAGEERNPAAETG